MEKGLRDCCRSIRIGKILIQSNEDTHEAKVSLKLEYIVQLPKPTNGVHGVKIPMTALGLIAETERASKGVPSNAIPLPSASIAPCSRCCYPRPNVPSMTSTVSAAFRWFTPNSQKMSQFAVFFLCIQSCRLAIRSSRQRESSWNME